MVIDEFKISEIKTKVVKNILESLNINNQKVSFLSKETDKNFYLSCRNLKNINTYRVEDVGVYQLMNCNTLIIDKNSIDYLNNLGKN